MKCQCFHTLYFDDVSWCILSSKFRLKQNHIRWRYWCLVLWFKQRTCFNKIQRQTKHISQVILAHLQFSIRNFPRSWNVRSVDMGIIVGTFDRWSWYYGLSNCWSCVKTTSVFQGMRLLRFKSWLRCFSYRVRLNPPEICYIISY